MFTDIPIDPAILEAKRQFQIQQTPLLHIDVEEEESGTNGEGRNDLASTPRLVISIDSIVENANFVSLE